MSTESTSAAPISSARLIEGFQADCRIRGMAPGSIPRYLSVIKIFSEYLDGCGVNLIDVDRDVLRGFLEYLRLERNVSHKTLENYFTVLSSLFEYLAYEGYVGTNPVLPVRKRYLRRYKENDEGQMRRLISVEEMAKLINSTMDIRDKTIITLLAKTGIRRNELVTLDVDDIDWVEQRIRLKPAHKRTNRIVFLDDETAVILHRWIKVRKARKVNDTTALFISEWGTRINRNGVYQAVTEAAERVGLHNPNSEIMEEHFSPHCCRHWFTTHLRRAGMPREFIQELRGDVRKESIDIYDHIDKKELRESYLAHIPQLGI
jgi:integrase/recombinase XerD